MRLDQGLTFSLFTRQAKKSGLVDWEIVSNQLKAKLWLAEGAEVQGNRGEGRRGSQESSDPPLPCKDFLFCRPTKAFL